MTHTKPASNVYEDHSDEPSRGCTTRYRSHGSYSTACRRMAPAHNCESPGCGKSRVPAPTPPSFATHRSRLCAMAAVHGLLLIVEYSQRTRLELWGPSNPVIVQVSIGVGRPQRRLPRAAADA